MQLLLAALKVDSCRGGCLQLTCQTKNLDRPHPASACWAARSHYRPYCCACVFHRLIVTVSHNTHLAEQGTQAAAAVLLAVYKVDLAKNLDRPHPASACWAARSRRERPQRRHRRWRSTPHPTAGALLSMLRFT